MTAVDFALALLPLPVFGHLVALAGGSTRARVDEV
jgi:hypothetical protein